MSGYLAPFLADEDFVTAMLVEITDHGDVHVVGCGHPPAFVRSGGEVHQLASTDTPPLGLAEPLGLTPAYETQTDSLDPADRIFLYTDGLIETRNPAGQTLPPSTITQCLQSTDDTDPLDTLIAALTDHAAPGGLNDDLALVLLEFDPTPLHPSSLRRSQHCDRSG